MLKTLCVYVVKIVSPHRHIDWFCKLWIILKTLCVYVIKKGCGLVSLYRHIVGGFAICLCDEKWVRIFLTHRHNDFYDGD
jgi:hypothetical protein